MSLKACVWGLLSFFSWINLNQMSIPWDKYVLSSLTHGREHPQIEFRFHKVNYFTHSSFPNDHATFWSIKSIQNIKLFKSMCNFYNVGPSVHTFIKQITKKRNKSNCLSFIRQILTSNSLSQDFFMQHCSCGAASLAFQELKRHFRSDHYSLTASSSTLSDLSTIPEVTRTPLRAAMRGQCANTPGVIH